MAAGAIKSFNKITIADATNITGTAIGSDTYSMILSDTKLSPDRTTATIDDGQDIIDLFKNGMEIHTYEATAFSDGHVISDTAYTTDKLAKVTLSGDTGTLKVTIDNVYLTGYQDPSGNRLKTVLMCGRNGSSDPATYSTS